MKKILLNLFDDLVKAIFKNNKIVTEDNNKTVTEDNNKTVTEDDNKIVTEDNNKIMIQYNNINDDNSNDSDNSDSNINDDNSNDSDNNNSSNNDDEYEIKQINNCFKMIDETESFEEQINLLKGMDLSEYWHMKYDYDKELNLKSLMLKIACL